ncbi:PorP/SprF family type IX secretion system membrane protein [Xanthomarina spongicola]|uniref:Type IX secretion system PorP/SprF family membrane protein n=1 Tax=Xanthomarina spongicola TaxID=570520 RepID=A0A316DS58_9FLAO|nr:type IX secretion system membrane protein PorP/SprF [Xanthomarina spongicola]PWK20921.1 type IX secretion system PorP/SprF family membrane protein [Xanthomarina spongicola]
MILKRFYILACVFLFAQTAISQEGMPIYSDYLTDNYYLIHPSMAGAANCAKIRITGRQQWFGDEDAPSLLTASINSRIGESNSGVGAILYSDKNGYHSNTGVYLTYAHHILFSRSELDLNMLSFGLSIGAIQYKLDETAFIDEPFDPIIAGIEQSATNFNVDFGFSYFLYNFYAHATVKNMLKNEGINSNENGLFVYDNPRQFLFSIGNVFQKFGSDWSFEPSAMFMYKDGTKESSIDINAKAYKGMDFGTVWGGISYRRSLDGAEFQDGTEVSSQKLQYITPLLGVDYNNFMFAYTYSYQANSVVYNNGGFHQITLGYKFGCKKERYHCNCPAIN